MYACERTCVHVLCDIERAIGILGFVGGATVYLGMHAINYLGHNYLVTCYRVQVCIVESS